MFGEQSIFDPGPHTSSATTITQVRAVSMDRATLRGWIAHRPATAEQLLRVLARQHRRTTNNLADLIFTVVPGRVARQLLQLARRFGTQEHGALRVTHDLTQEEIAQLVGSSRETVHKTLSDFAQRGWIRLDGKSVLISDTERLARRAHYAPSVPRLSEDTDVDAVCGRPSARSRVAAAQSARSSQILTTPTCLALLPTLRSLLLGCTRPGSSLAGTQNATTNPERIAVDDSETVASMSGG
jgi:hypothetical protein